MDSPIGLLVPTDPATYTPEQIARHDPDALFAAMIVTSYPSTAEDTDDYDIGYDQGIEEFGSLPAWVLTYEAAAAGRTESDPEWRASQSNLPKELGRHQAIRDLLNYLPNS